MTLGRSAPKREIVVLDDPNGLFHGTRGYDIVANGMGVRVGYVHVDPDGDNRLGEQIFLTRSQQLSLPVPAKLVKLTQLLLDELNGPDGDTEPTRAEREYVDNLSTFLQDVLGGRHELGITVGSNDLLDL
jgi:hypothetical protein